MRKMLTLDFVIETQTMKTIREFFSTKANVEQGVECGQEVVRVFFNSEDENLVREYLKKHYSPDLTEEEVQDIIDSAVALD